VSVRQPFAALANHAKMARLRNDYYDAAATEADVSRIGAFCHQSQISFRRILA
jgi:hypothetical protein